MAAVIVKQPENVVAPVGATAQFIVEAAGEGLAYKWQYRNKGGTSWLSSPLATSTTPALSVPVTETRDGMSYRCMITDAGGEIVFTDAAYLFVLRKGTLEYDTMVDIADAIRAQLAITSKIAPGDMAGLIGSIGSGSSVMSGTFTVASSSASANLGTAFPDTGTYVLCIWQGNEFGAEGVVLGTIIGFDEGESFLGLSTLGTGSHEHTYGTNGTYLDVSTGVVTAGQYWADPTETSYSATFNGSYTWVCVAV